jgi:hypothetical protein
MPAVSGTSPGTRTRPKYPIDGSALVVYRGPNAYVAIAQRGTRAALTPHADVRVLAPQEARALEDDLALPPLAGRRDRSAPVRLGDAVHGVLTRVGIRDCTGCRRRRRRLNKLTVWGWWRKPNGE